MALTAAQRQRKRRQKLKEDGRYEEYRKRHNETAKKSRDKIKSNEQRSSADTKEKMQRERREKGRKRIEKMRRLQKERKEERATEVTGTTSVVVQSGRIQKTSS